MSNRQLTITLDVPDELVQRAEALGIALVGKASPWVDYLETEIRRREAALDLLDIARRLDTLPDEWKPSPDEIQGAVKQARAELRAKSDNVT
jgi:hypothetical protein